MWQNYLLVLVVGFASGQFDGSESSRFIEVIVRITGGSSSTPITVTVTPSVQSPVSAMGRQWLLTVNISTTNYCTVIGSGVDFNSNPLTITINAGATDGRANVSVSCDNVTEGFETFDMRLTVTSSSSGVTLGRDTCKGQIIDSTGTSVMYMYVHKFLLLINILNSWGELQPVIIWSNGRWWYSEYNDSIESNIISTVWSYDQYNRYHCYRYVNMFIYG